MHEARKNEVLMAYHHFAHSCKNRNFHSKNREVFIALKMQKLYLCLSSHDHVKFLHDCEKLIGKAIGIRCLWTISQDYVKVIMKTVIK